MIYGFVTSLLLPNLFYDRLSNHFYKNKDFNEKD